MGCGGISPNAHSPSLAGTYRTTADYTGRERRGISMPICFMPGRFPGTDKDEVRARALGESRTAPIREALGESRTAPIKEPSGVAPAIVPTHPEWREPPGYLGEAVRRAKRIASLSQSVGPSQPIIDDR